MRTILRWRLPNPTTRTGRLVLGVALILGGVLGFLPVLGFWMVPLGLIVLSQDFPAVRKFRRKLEVKLGRRWYALRKYGPLKMFRRNER